MGRNKNAAFICKNHQIDISFNYISKILSLSPIISHYMLKCLFALCLCWAVCVVLEKQMLAKNTHSLPRHCNLFSCSHKLSLSDRIQEDGFVFKLQIA